MGVANSEGEIVQVLASADAYRRLPAIELRTADMTIKIFASGEIECDRDFDGKMVIINRIPAMILAAEAEAHGRC